MCDARPCGRGAGSTQSPVGDLSAARMEAKQSRIFRHDVAQRYVTVRRFCNLIARMYGFMRPEADVRQADGFISILKCARTTSGYDGP